MIYWDYLSSVNAVFFERKQFFQVNIFLVNQNPIRRATETFVTLYVPTYSRDFKSFPTWQDLANSCSKIFSSVWLDENRLSSTELDLALDPEDKEICTDELNSRNLKPFKYFTEAFKNNLFLLQYLPRGPVPATPSNGSWHFHYGFSTCKCSDHGIYHSVYYELLD